MSKDQPVVMIKAGPCSIGSRVPQPPDAPLLRLILARVLGRQADREAGS